MVGQEIMAFQTIILIVLIPKHYQLDPCIATEGSAMVRMIAVHAYLVLLLMVGMEIMF
jgi:hypothetical protein